MCLLFTKGRKREKDRGKGGRKKGKKIWLPVASKVGERSKRNKVRKTKLKQEVEDNSEEFKNEIQPVLMCWCIYHSDFVGGEESDVVSGALFEAGHFFHKEWLRIVRKSKPCKKISANHLSDKGLELGTYKKPL